MLGPILIVEDDDGVRETLREVLSETGRHVACARNGAEALDALAGGAPTPAVILLDLMMPVMDGYEFRARQLADPRWRLIPVIVLTAHADGNDTAAALAAPVLIKPFDIDALCSRIDQACRPRGVS